MALTKLNIAVIGKSGSGKSSFINTIREMNKGSQFAAKVGIKECTSGKPISYAHPENENIQFWDFPGYGTKATGTGEEFMRRCSLSDYHLCFVLYCDRIMKDDEDVIEKLSTENKKHFIIRNKIDHDIDNETRDLKLKVDKDEKEKDVIQRLEDECQEILQGKALYMLSSVLINRAKWHFPKLLKDIIIGVPVDYQSSLEEALTANTMQHIGNKMEQLRKDLRKDARISLFDSSMLEQKIIKYMDDIDMNWKTLKHRCYIYDRNSDEVKVTWNKTSFAKDIQLFIKELHIATPDHYIAKVLHYLGLPIAGAGAGVGIMGAAAAAPAAPVAVAAPGILGAIAQSLGVVAAVETTATAGLAVTVGAVAAPLMVTGAATTAGAMAYSKYAKHYAILEKVLSIFEEDAKVIVTKMYG